MFHICMKVQIEKGVFFGFKESVSVAFCLVCKFHFKGHSFGGKAFSIMQKSSCLKASHRVEIASPINSPFIRS